MNYGMRVSYCDLGPTMDRGKDGGRRHGALLLLTLLPMSYKGMVVTLAFGKTSITKRGYYHVTIL
jgi:hypothetical protein